MISIIFNLKKHLIIKDEISYLSYCHRRNECFGNDAMRTITGSFIYVLNGSQNKVFAVLWFMYCLSERFSPVLSW